MSAELCWETSTEIKYLLPSDVEVKMHGAFPTCFCLSAGFIVNSYAREEGEICALKQIKKKIMYLCIPCN
jgi:hypothetical protein